MTIVGNPTRARRSSPTTTATIRRPPTTRPGSRPHGSRSGSRSSTRRSTSCVVPAERGRTRAARSSAWTGREPLPRLRRLDRERSPGSPDLRDLHLANGFHLECLEPLTTYRIRHRTEQIDVDITFRALMEPNPVAAPRVAGHVRRPRRATRSGAGPGPPPRPWHDVDCGSVRDRSWGPRTMRPGMRIGNAHGTSVDGWAFFAYVNPDARRTRADHRRLLADRRAGRSHGRRASARTVLDGDFPAAVVIDATDALGRHLQVRGECRNRQAVDAGHDLYAVLEPRRVGTSVAERPRGARTTTSGRGRTGIAAGRAPLPVPLIAGIRNESPQVGNSRG